jgi:predicted CXXCH cytochrome family protein
MKREFLKGRNRFQVFVTLALCCGAISAALILSACSSIERTATISVSNDGADFVGNAACVDCHKSVTDVFHGSMHSRVRLADPEIGDTSCETCHGPGSKHVAMGGSQRRAMHITNPGRDSTACFKCHLQQHAEFKLPYRHPVVDGPVSCVTCHDPHAAEIMKPRALAMRQTNGQCADCHEQQTRQFVFEHEALREGCITCHQPHGSIHPDLLKQRDANLCLRCHAQVPGAGGGVLIGKTDHSTFLTRGTCWSSGCHTAVHGSNINPHLRY